MIKRFFQWRAMRQLRGESYSLGKMRHKGKFGPAFLIHFGWRRFRETGSEQYYAARRRRLVFLIIFRLGLLAFLCWFLFESVVGVLLF